MTSKLTFARTRVQDWKAALDYAEALAGWVFRGHGDTKWELKTRLERDAGELGRPRFTNPERERTILREFKRRAHHYLPNVPENDRLVEWLSLIQHYGGPTRLLDVTDSFYVAAFFAMEYASSDAAIWAFNLNKMMPKKKSREEYLRECTVEAEKNIEDKNKWRQKVIAVQPERLHERLSIQRGLFLFPCMPFRPFLENFAWTFGFVLHAEQIRQLTDSTVCEQVLSCSEISSKVVVKLELPRKMHYHALIRLDEMNINAATLFPGLDGFARSLRTRMRFPNFAKRVAE